MIRNNSFLSSTRKRPTLSQGLSRMQRQHLPFRNTIEPEILYSTGPSGQDYVRPPRPDTMPFILHTIPVVDDIFPEPAEDFSYHDSSTMSIPDLIHEPSSPTTTASSLSPRSSLSEISALWDDHQFHSKTAAVPSLLRSDVLACADYSLSQHYQLVQPIWSVDREENKFLRQVACIANECARAPERKVLNALSNQEIQDLEDRAIFEFWKYGNGRDGHLSLSTHNTSLEDAVAGYATNGSAYIDVSNVNLAQLIREFSPMLTVAEIMPCILAWVGPAYKHSQTKEEKGLRARRFEHLKCIIIEEIMRIWSPPISEEKMRGKRLLTRKEYACVAARLCRKGQLSGSEIYQLHNTVRGLDMLELLGRCLRLELVVSTDVTLIGETLAQHFCEDGYSFALYTLFKYAGDKICRGNAERFACLAVDEAASELWLNVHSYEDREFHTRLGRMVDEYGRIQREKYIAGAPKNRPDRRPIRADYRRQIHFVSDLIHYL